MKDKDTHGYVISAGHTDRELIRKVIGASFDAEHPKYAADLIAADAGLLVCREAGLVPAHIVGDFDSLPDDSKQLLGEYAADPRVVIHPYQPQKDWTDTELAVDLGIRQGWKEITILGGTGTRLDHVLGNVQVLALARSRGCKACLLDEHNRVTIHNSPFTLQRSSQWGRYVSFFAWGGEVKGLTLTGFAYDVCGITLGSEGTLSVSNRIHEEAAQVVFSEGRVLCIESRD